MKGCCLSRRARTQEAKESRRMDLIQAARILFEQQGYVMPSVTDIVSQADLAKGTFYLYFETKEELFLEMLELGFMQWMASLQEHIDRSTLDDPARLAQAVVKPILHDSCFLQLASMAQSILEQNLRAERAIAFKQRLGQGMEALAQDLQERFEVSAPLMIDLMMDCYAVIIGTWQTTQVTQSMAEVQHMIPYPLLFQRFEDRIERLITQLITGRYALR
jgi:AcrR family transcriptional regulator